MKNHAFTLLAAALIAGAPTARAQWVVVDPTNLVQNVLTAARALEQIDNQVRQLRNEAQMLSNQARHLASLDFSALARLQASLAATRELIEQAQGLAFTVSKLEDEFARLYPQAYTSAHSGRQMAGDAQVRGLQALDALRTATRVQAQSMQNLVSDEQALTDLLRRSQSAEGALQAAQATNELLALQARQTIQGHQLRITQDRAVALLEARHLAAEQRAREVRRRFHGRGTPYTPHEVNFYGS